MKAYLQTFIVDAGREKERNEPANFLHSVENNDCVRFP